MDNLYNNLETYKNSGVYPYHMPGHKRNMHAMPMAEAYAIDLTEIEGSDNLYHAGGILKEAMLRAANLYHAEETHFLVNGSTGGILSAVAACVKRGGTLLLARNSHRCVYNAMMQKNLRGRYLQPAYNGKWQIAGGITPEAVREALEADSNIQAVFITSPTYEGLVSDIKGIADEAHRYSIPLIVDEAHGAHFGLDERLPASAVSQGADIVIQSLHKTLPAFTQTALLHVNGDRVDREKLRRYLSVYQTSSPSYVLMAGIDQCISLLQEKRAALFEQFYHNRQQFLEQIKQLRHIQVLDRNETGLHGAVAIDACKLVISVSGTSCSGQKLYELLLHRYGLQMEMAASTYVLAILTIMDTKEGFDRLAEALLAIDRTLYAVPRAEKEGMSETGALPLPQAVLTIAEAVDKEWEKCTLALCCGRIAADYICIYPPGIPIIVPGEVVTDRVIGQITQYQREGLHILGIEENQNRVKVVK